MDFVISGENASGQAICIIYINNEGNSFSDATAGIEGHVLGEVAWSDIDNDEDLDFAIIGTNLSGTPETIIYINNEYVRQGKLYLDEMFTIESVLDLVNSERRSIPGEVSRFKSLLKTRFCNTLIFRRLSK